jgi:hypothetical protein
MTTSTAQRTHATLTAAPARAANAHRPAKPRAEVAARAAENKLGNQAMQALLREGFIQAKPSVGAPSDPLEREADSVANQVMRMPASSGLATPHVQRRWAQCDDARFDEPGMQNVHSALGNGRPLSPSVRSFLEPRFGRDLGHVSVHTDPAAADSARALNARAYTLGSNIAFAQGEYQPGSHEGRRLLAHEITHTFQQGHGAAPDGQVQRSRNDRNNLDATRFAGNQILEAAYDGESVVMIGQNDSGTHVRLLQQSLLDMGYTLPEFGVDGQFGEETAAAVEMFQHDAGAFLVDGKVGSETMQLFNIHDVTRPGGNGPPPRTGPVPGPLPAPNETCDTRYAGVTFTLANEVASGVSPAAWIAIQFGSNPAVLELKGVTPANYKPEVTIHAPDDATAREFQVGFASNVLTQFVGYFFTSGTSLLKTTMPTPIKDGGRLADNEYDPVFVKGPKAGVLEDFTANGDTRNLVWPDKVTDGVRVNSADNPECGAGARPGTVAAAAVIDSFRTWVVVRHRASGCTQALHHIDWDINWQASIEMVGGAPRVHVVTNDLNVTVADGDGSPPFVQGGPVANDFRDDYRECT